MNNECVAWDKDHTHLVTKESLEVLKFALNI